MCTKLNFNKKKKPTYRLEKKIEVKKNWKIERIIHIKQPVSNNFRQNLSVRKKDNN